MKPLRRYADIHTHRADAGPDAVVCIDPSQGVVTLRPEQPYSIGIHPWNAARADSLAIDRLRQFAYDPQVVCIGEAGLDALHPHPELQEELFRMQALLAEQVGKPLVIHCVRRWAELMKLKREINPSQEWIVHGFRGKPELAKQLLDAGFSISLGAKHNPVVPFIVPPDRLYRETD